MTAEEHAQSLEALAVALGVTRSYHDGTGRFRRAGDDALLAVLRALGAPVERIEDCAEALRILAEPSTRAAFPATACAVEGDGGYVALPPGSAPVASASLQLESGDRLPCRIETAADGGRRVRISRHTPGGVHRLTLENDAPQPHSVLVFVAPSRLPEAPRAWGLFAPLYALHHAGPAPRMAVYGDLARLARWMTAGPDRSRRHRDVALLGTLPLLAGFLDNPFEPSPYSPISRAFWSELYVDPQATPEFAAAAASGPGGDAPPASVLLANGRLDYRGAMRVRRAAIEALHASLEAHGGARRDAFERCLDEDEDLASWAAFRATVERHGTTWERWPARARGGQLRAGVDYDGATFRYHAYAQWLARQQFADAADASPAGFYLDLPLGSHGGGYDTWRHASDYAFGVTLGAPPDDVFDGGQDWGFPPLHPQRSKSSGFASLRAALRRHFEHAAVLRIDHVMAMHRAFWIPQGFTAADGVYVRSPADELWSLVAIEATRGRQGRGSAVVGEDLGTVPPEVRREMHGRGALRMHVIPFECHRDGNAPLADPPREALVCLDTHDMEPFASWWSSDGCPRAALSSFLGCTERADEALPALLSWIAASDATIAIASLEDLWLERERQNLPGTSAGEHNWQRPFARTFADFTSDPELRRLVDLVRGAAGTGGVR